MLNKLFLSIKKFFSSNNREFSLIILRSILLSLSYKKNIDDNEIMRMRTVFAELMNADIDVNEVKQELQNIDSWKPDLLNYYTKIGPNLDFQAKLLILKACVFVAESDQLIQDEEMLWLQELAKMLRFDEHEFRSLLKNYMKDRNLY